MSAVDWGLVVFTFTVRRYGLPCIISIKTVVASSHCSALNRAFKYGGAHWEEVGYCPSAGAEVVGNGVVCWFELVDNG